MSGQVLKISVYRGTVLKSWWLSLKIKKACSDLSEAAFLNTKAAAFFLLPQLSGPNLFLFEHESWRQQRPYPAFPPPVQPTLNM
jgi:hypothetical protein